VRYRTDTDKDSLSVYKKLTAEEPVMQTHSQTVMILEDEALIALDIEKLLDDAGFADVSVFGSCTGALAWLARNTPDVAVVDIFLRDGECIEVADILVERSVPFVVHSARRKVTSEAHRVFLHGEWIAKPVDPAVLIAKVKGCLSVRSARRAAA
jgi:DNA-binding response OmpR family regulator